MASEQTYQRYRRLARYPLFIAGLMFLAGFGLLLDPYIDTIEYNRHLGRILTLISWAMFLADYVISLILSPDRKNYVQTHILQAIGVLFPPLRILLIFHVTFTVVTHTKGAFGHRMRLYLLYASTLSILVCSVTVLIAERSAPDATIRNFGDSLWWAAETVSTVGYGDMYPVTFLGRLVAVALMVNGFLILSALAATLSQAFVYNQLGIAKPDTTPEPEPET